VDIVHFRSGADVVAPLGSGQLDVGTGSPSAGLYNAVARGIKLKIVADKGSSQPGFPANQVLVRKDLVESGRYKTLADLKGMRIALSGPGVSNQVTLNDTLKSVGLTLADVTTIDMPFSSHIPALQNKAVDAAVPTEPTISLAIRRGLAVSVMGDDKILPGHQTSTLLYSENFATKRTDEARKFMRAYLRGVRFYIGALRNGHLEGPHADEIIDILTKVTPVKDPAVFRAVSSSGCSPDGRVNIDSLKHDLAFYREHGYIKGNVSVDQVVDYSFVDWAVKELGPYRP
jgi:NitT/TauT family transport system substrate-binding protein